MGFTTVVFCWFYCTKANFSPLHFPLNEVYALTVVREIRFFPYKSRRISTSNCEPKLKTIPYVAGTKRVAGSHKSQNFDTKSPKMVWFSKWITIYVQKTHFTDKTLLSHIQLKREKNRHTQKNIKNVHQWHGRTLNAHTAAAKWV